MLKLIKKIVGTQNDRELKRLWPLVRQVNELEEATAALSDEDLRAKTAEFRARIDEATKGSGPTSRRLDKSCATSRPRRTTRAKRRKVRARPSAKVRKSSTRWSRLCWDKFFPRRLPACAKPHDEP